MSRRGLAALVVLALTVASPAAALSSPGAPVPGASYTGTAADGATIQFTISSDGTLVDSYAVLGIQGTDSHGASCQGTAEGAKGVLTGVSIVNGAFTYSIGSTFTLNGTFTGPQSASGSFALANPALGAGTGCSTGTVAWTATTTATPPSGGGGGTNPGGTGNPGGNGNKPHKPTIATKVKLRRLSKAKLTGEIKVSNQACRANRTVYLWRGGKRIGRARTKHNGAFNFARSTAARNHLVHAAAVKLTTSKFICAAGASAGVRG